MSKLHRFIIAFSALALALQAGMAMSETARKKSATAKNAVGMLQNGYTASDTSARPQLIEPNEYALVKVVGTSGGGTGGTQDPEAAADENTSNGGTGGTQESEAAADENTSNGGTGGTEESEAAADENTSNGGTGGTVTPESAS